MNYQTLWTEIVTDPLGRGYSGMTDDLVARDLNTVYRTTTRDTLSSADIYEQIVVTEFQTLQAAKQGFVRDILGLGDNIQVGPNSKARAVMVGCFGAGSETIQNLAAILQESISRATELGLPRIYVQDVETARQRYGG